MNPVEMLFAPPDPDPTPDSVPKLLAAGEYHKVPQAVWQIGAAVFEGTLNVPLEQLLHWLDLLPADLQRTSSVRYLRVWLYEELHRYQLAGLLLDELAAEWEAKLHGPDHEDAASWMMFIRIGQGVVADAQCWYERAHEAFADATRYFPPQLMEQVRRLADGMEWSETQRLSIRESEGLNAAMSNALSIFRARSNRPALGRMAHVLGCSYLRSGEPAAARHYLKAALELKRGLPGYLPLSATLISLGECYQQLGLLDEAHGALDEVLRMSDALGHTVLQASALSLLGDVHRDKEEYQSAHDLYQKALAIQERARDTYAMARTYISLSTMYRRAGHAGLAVDAAVEARLLAAGQRSQVHAVMAELHEQIGLLLLGNSDAPENLANLIPRLVELHLPQEEILGRWYQAVAAHRAGDRGKAVTYMRMALSSAARLRNLHALAMEVAVVPELLQAAGRLEMPDAMAGLVRRMPPRGLVALLEVYPDAIEIVKAAGRLPETAALHVSLLGPFRVERSGRELDLAAARSQKAVRLFKFLVAHRGHPVAREQILEAIWPEADPESADRTFDVTLSTLKRLLDAPGSPPAIVRRGRGYQINPDVPLICDVDRFAAHLERGSWWWQRGQHGLAAAEWELAVEAYGGDLMADDPYEDWATAERERLREQYLELLLRLGELDLEAGRCGNAVDRAYRVLNCDPIREAAHRLLMKAHAQQGNRAAAMRDLERCAEILRRELGEQPMEETLELARRIRTGEYP